MKNAALQAFLVGVDESLLQPPVNVLRLSLHPKGLAPRIANLATWRAHILTRLQRQTVVTGDPVLARLLTELSGYPGGDETAPAEEELHAVHDDAREAHAAAWELNYVALGGDIGCMVNGAGLAMASA